MKRNTANKMISAALTILMIFGLSGCESEKSDGYNIEDDPCYEQTYNHYKYGTGFSGVCK